MTLLATDCYIVHKIYNDYFHDISLPAGMLSLAWCTLYGISWQSDPHFKYQVEYDAYRKRLHNTIALATLVYCVKKICELYAV
ncbi:Transmembrane protein 11 [Heterocephalus glaber]|uniref:Transmembrane protein 11 n=1 Tax=Heterocephalus glaber TaxID=10181 RepID=G5C1L4_HETGA|nr:Transmembrane protein 11 [Heterocephalus glaber]